MDHSTTTKAFVSPSVGCAQIEYSPSWVAVCSSDTCQGSAESDWGNFHLRDSCSKVADDGVIRASQVGVSLGRTTWAANSSVSPSSMLRLVHHRLSLSTVAVSWPLGEANPRKTGVTAKSVRPAPASQAPVVLSACLLDGTTRFFSTPRLQSPSAVAHQPHRAPRCLPTPHPALPPGASWPRRCCPCKRAAARPGGGLSGTRRPAPASS